MGRLYENLRDTPLFAVLGAIALLVPAAVGSLAALGMLGYPHHAHPWVVLLFGTYLALAVGCLVAAVLAAAVSGWRPTWTVRLSICSAVASVLVILAAVLVADYVVLLARPGSVSRRTDSMGGMRDAGSVQVAVQPHVNVTG